IPGQGQVLINEVRVAKPVCARRGSVTVCERRRNDEGGHVDKGSNSPVSFELHIPGKGRIITGPASARLRHIAGRGERPERRARSEPSDTGDLPAAHHRSYDTVFRVEHAPLPERQFVSVERVEEVRLIRGGKALFLDIRAAISIDGAERLAEGIVKV